MPAGQKTTGLSPRERRGLARARLLDAKNGFYNMAIAVRSARYLAISYREISILTGLTETEVRKIEQY